MINTLGTGFLESVYKNSLQIALLDSGLKADLKMLGLFYPAPKKESQPYLGLGGSVGGFCALAGCGCLACVLSPVIAVGEEWQNTSGKSRFWQMECDVPVFYLGSHHRKGLLPLRGEFTFGWGF